MQTKYISHRTDTQCKLNRIPVAAKPALASTTETGEERRLLHCQLFTVLMYSTAPHASA